MANANNKISSKWNKSLYRDVRFHDYTRIDLTYKIY